MKVDLPAITPVEASDEVVALVKQLCSLTAEAEEQSFDITIEQMRNDMTAQDMPKALIDKCVSVVVDIVMPYAKELRTANLLKNYSQQQLQAMLEFYTKNPWFFEINSRTSYALGKTIADVAQSAVKQVIMNDPLFEELLEREMADANTYETLSADDPRRNLENATSIALKPFDDNDSEFERGVSVIDATGKHQHNCGCIDCHPSDCICKFCNED